MWISELDIESLLDSSLFVDAQIFRGYEQLQYK